MRRFKKYNPSAKEYPKLGKDLSDQLSVISPSHSFGMDYYPCMVTLDDQSVADRVYVVNAQKYIAQWGAWPEDDPEKKEVDLDHVIRIENSPTRLPSHIANEIYMSGESGMGYCLFTLEFSDGSRQAYLAGNAVDFVEYPKGKSGIDIERVIPQEGRSDPDILRTLDYHWCLFD